VPEQQTHIIDFIIIKDLEITKTNQVWISDITYIKTIKGFCSLALITDKYSLKVNGSTLV